MERVQTVISRIAILVSVSVFAGICVILVRRVLANWKRRRQLVAMELRLADALEAFHQEVFRLKHYRVLRAAASGRNAQLIPSTNMSSLRYIKGRENAD